MDGFWSLITKNSCEVSSIRRQSCIFHGDDESGKKLVIYWDDHHHKTRGTETVSNDTQALVKE